MTSFTNRIRLFVPVFVFAGCSSLTVEGVNFAWPVESVQSVNSMNRIEERRYALAMDVLPLALAEFQDSSALLGATLRIIRNSAGFTFMTGPRFRHVYVFRQGEGALHLTAALAVSATGLESPAFNQRPPYIELLDGGTAVGRLTSTELIEEAGR